MLSGAVIERLLDLLAARPGRDQWKDPGWSALSNDPGRDQFGLSLQTQRILGLDGIIFGRGWPDIDPVRVQFSRL
jgi:hypothetical protein